MRLLLALAIGVGVFLTAASASAAPRDYYGVVSQAQLETKDFERMSRGGVGALRIPVSWASTQRTPASYDWTELDRTVVEAASEGVEVLPFVYRTPAWVADDPARPPLDDQAARSAWRAFLDALVDRYGRGGEVWDGVADPMPIRSWQIWNEPNYPPYWQPRPSAAEYAKLLAISAEAVRASDPKAKIVAGGLPPVTSGPWPWRYLEDLYEADGVKRNFDEVALHPYSRDLRGIKVQVRRARAVIKRAGDAQTPIAITELGTSSRPPGVGSAARGERKQARYLSRAFDFITQKRRPMGISSVFWFAWQDVREVKAGCSFCAASGLFTQRGNAKPAWRSFQRFSIGRR